MELGGGGLDSETEPRPAARAPFRNGVSRTDVVAGRRANNEHPPGLVRPSSPGSHRLSATGRPAVRLSEVVTQPATVRIPRRKPRGGETILLTRCRAARQGAVTSSRRRSGSRGQLGRLSVCSRSAAATYRGARSILHPASASFCANHEADRRSSSPPESAAIPPARPAAGRRVARGMFPRPAGSRATKIGRLRRRTGKRQPDADRPSIAVSAAG